MCEALRRESSPSEDIANKYLVAQHVAKVIVRRDRIRVESGEDLDAEITTGAFQFRMTV